MFIRYFKGTPDFHVMRFKNGAVRQAGRGLSFWYNPFGTTIALVPVTSLDNPFIFTETTSNFQELAIQGAVSYRITDPFKAAEGFDFNLKAGGQLTGDGREKIAERLVMTIQGHTRAVISRMTLAEALGEVTKLGGVLTEQVREDPIVQTAGLSIESVHITSARTSPETQQALQAEYRESLQRQADEAIYGRRAAALEKERAIKQSEVATEIEIAERRKLLVDTEARNTLTLAEASAKAQQLELAVYASTPTNVLTAMAFKSWAEKGGAVGNLSITPDMLTSALAQLSAPAAAAAPDNQRAPRTNR